MENDKLGYHDYFALIYRTERQRIINLQLGLLEVAKHMWNQVI